jgi:prevent-host-death family protein
MKKLKLTEATASLAEYTRELNHGPLVVTAHGKPVAALVPIEGVDWETLCVGTSPKFLDIIEQSRRRYETEGGISSEEMRQHLGLKPKGKRKSIVSNQKSKGRGV